MQVTSHEAAAVPGAQPDRRETIAAAAASAAWFAFLGAIILSPFRARFVLDERPLPPVFGDYRDSLLFWSEIFILALLVFWGVSLALRHRHLDFGPLLIRVPVIAVLLAAFASVPFGVEPGLALFNAITLVGFAAFALYVVNEVGDVRRLAPAIAVMVVLQAVVAVGQVLSQASFGLQALGEFDLDPQSTAISVLWTEDAPRLLRAYGLSDHPNILGGVMAFALPVLAVGLGRAQPTGLPLVSAVFGLGAVALFVTFSRSAALGLACGVALPLALLALRRDWRTFGLWSAACVVAVLMIAPLVRPYEQYLSARINPSGQQAGSTEERALSERRALIKNTNEVFVRHPVAGVGVGGLPTAMYEAYPDFGYHHAPAHFVILVVAAEIGLVGAFAYGVIMLAPWLLLWFRRRHLTPELTAVSGALLAVTVVGFFDYYTWSLTAGRFWFWLVLALWVVAYRRALARADDA